MNLITYNNFTKKNNSTRQPSGGTTHNVYLKEDCSVLHPIFLIDGIDLSVNYCRWNNRYYFVDEIVINTNNIYELHCTFDAMATYKSNIGASSQYVLRSADEYDGTVVDTFYPSKKEPTYMTRSPSTAPSWATSVDGGYYIIGVLGGNAIGTGTVSQGAVKYYVMTPAAMAQLGEELFDSSNYSAWNEAYKYAFNPIQYISSIKWFPFAPPQGLPAMTLPLGWEHFSIANNSLTNAYATQLFQFAVDRHPQAATRGSYLNSSPYSDYALVFPPFGEIDLDPDQISELSLFNVLLKVDFITGKAQLIGRGVPSENTVVELFRREVMLGVNVQIAQITQNALGLMQSEFNTAAGFIGGIASGNFGSALTSLSSGIVSSYNLKFPTAKSQGSNDTMISVLGDFVAPVFYERFYEIVDEDNTTCGRPLCQQRTISSLPGYNLCANAEIEIPGFPEERDQIVQYLNSGFYYE